MKLMEILELMGELAAADGAPGELVQAATMPSPVDRVVTFGRAVAAMDEPTDDQRVVAAAGIELAIANGWHGMQGGEGAQLLEDIGPLPEPPAETEEPA